MDLNVIGAVVGVGCGSLITVLVTVYRERIDWRRVNMCITLATFPFALGVAGASWPDFKNGLIASVALLFGLSVVTQFMAAMGAWRSDENPPPTD